MNVVSIAGGGHLAFLGEVSLRTKPTHERRVESRELMISRARVLIKPCLKLNYSEFLSHLRQQFLLIA